MTKLDDFLAKLKLKRTTLEKEAEDARKKQMKCSDLPKSPKKEIDSEKDWKSIPKVEASMVVPGSSNFCQAMCPYSFNLS